MEHTEKHKSEIVFAQMHIFSPAWAKNLCTFTQIMCNLHKSRPTLGPIDQPAQIANHIYTILFFFYHFPLS